LILADATEHGWDSIANLPEDQLFEADVLPIVWAIETQTDMVQALEKAAPLVAAGRIKSIAIDSLSFYADLALNAIMSQQAKEDTRQAYGKLGNHLRNMRCQFQVQKLNVVWTALVKHPDEDNLLGRPLIPGQQGAKFEAGVDFIMHSRKEVPLNPIQAAKTPPVYELRTKQWGRYIAGNRLGERADRLLDPFVGSYSDFIYTLGYDVQALRDSMPAITEVATKPAVIKAPTPPIVKAGSSARPNNRS
jgi:hypothetical protein